MEKIQFNKNIWNDFSGITLKVALYDLSRKMINVKNKGKLRKYHLKFIESLFETEVMRQMRVNICNLPDVDGLSV